LLWVGGGGGGGVFCAIEFESHLQGNSLSYRALQ